MGMLYGDLRLKNILIKMDDEKKKVLDVKLMSFGHMKHLDDIQNICLPALIDHLPPDLLTILED